MSRDNPWAKHYQAGWKLKSADRRLAAWMRVTFLAYSRHRANGHAQFRAGELAELLGSKEQPLAGTNVRRAIRAAIDAGWLGKESKSRCLVVPRHDVTGGLGEDDEPCPIHDRTRSKNAARSATKRGSASDPPSAKRGSASDPPEDQPVILSQRSDLRKREAPSMTLLPTPATAPSAWVTAADEAAALRSAPVALEPVGHRGGALAGDTSAVDDETYVLDQVAQSSGEARGRVEELCLLLVRQKLTTEPWADRDELVDEFRKRGAERAARMKDQRRARNPVAILKDVKPPRRQKAG